MYKDFCIKIYKHQYSRAQSNYGSNSIPKFNLISVEVSVLVMAVVSELCNHNKNIYLFAVGNLIYVEIIVAKFICVFSSCFFQYIYLLLSRIVSGDK